MPEKPWLPTAWGGRELDPFRGFRSQLDSLFEDWFGRSMGGTLAPRVDVSETAKEVTLKVEADRALDEETEEMEIDEEGELVERKPRRHPAHAGGGRATEGAGRQASAEPASAPVEKPLKATRKSAAKA